MTVFKWVPRDHSLDNTRLLAHTHTADDRNPAEMQDAMGHGEMASISTENGKGVVILGMFLKSLAAVNRHEFVLPGSCSVSCSVSSRVSSSVWSLLFRALG